MSFDPNKNPGEWATYIERRTPKFKIHAKKGHAISAIKSSSYYSKDLSHIVVNPEAKLYKRGIDGLWVEVELNKTYPTRRDGGGSIIKGE